MSGEKEAPVELSIETGPHVGVKRQLSFGFSTIGTSLDSDIVLADDCMVEHHAELTLARNGVAIKAVGGDVNLSGHPGTVHAGESRSAAWPAHVTLGRTRFSLSPAGGAGISRRKTMPGAGYLSMLTGAGVLLAGVLLASQYWPSIGGAETSDPEESGLSALDGIMTRKAEPFNLNNAPTETIARETSDPVDIAVERLKDQLANAGLTEIGVTGEDGAVVVDGLLAEDRSDRWRDVEMWFDQRFGSTIPLDSRLAIDDAKGAPSIAIRAVWSGSSPYLVAGDGERYGEGSVLPDGWTLDTIEPNTVIFRQASRTFRFDVKG